MAHMGPRLLNFSHFLKRDPFPAQSDTTKRVFPKRAQLRFDTFYEFGYVIAGWMVPVYRSFARRFLPPPGDFLWPPNQRTHEANHPFCTPRTVPRCKHAMWTLLTTVYSANEDEYIAAEWAFASFCCL